MRENLNRNIKTLNILITALLVLGFSHTPWVEQYVISVKSGEARSVFNHQREVDGLQAEAVEAIPVMASLSDEPGSSGISTGENREELRAKLEEEAARTRIPPVDARVDRIWKAIPGLNGRELDVEKTLETASRQPEGSPITYFYREIPPKIGLADLGAQPIYRGNPDKKMISLMINVAWGDEYLASMLETLRKENVHATFFLDGTWLKGHQEQAKAIAAAGHELSNHAYSHKNMSRLSDSAAREEIAKTEQLLKGIGVKNKLFAPPSGDFNSNTVRIAHEMKLQTILWTLDTLDWKKPAPEAVIRKITSKLVPGALILMHPTEASMHSLGEIIRFAKQQGYALGTVSELISPERLPELETKLRK